MQGVLYFPMINVPDSAWLMHSLLYWDAVGAIIPERFVDQPRAAGRVNARCCVRSLCSMPFRRAPTGDSSAPSATSYPLTRKECAIFVRAQMGHQVWVGAGGLREVRAVRCEAGRGQPVLRSLRRARHGVPVVR